MVGMLVFLVIYHSKIMYMTVFMGFPTLERYLNKS